MVIIILLSAKQGGMKYLKYYFYRKTFILKLRFQFKCNNADDGLKTNTINHQ